MSRNTRLTLPAWGLVAACAALLPACERRLPGPKECHAMAERWLAIASNGRSERPASEREVLLVDDTVVKLTTECLTRPFDRELVSCVGNGGTPRACIARFETRFPAR